MPRALISVTDKTGVVEFASGLAQRGFDLASTGGTARLLREAGLAVTEVAEITQFPEMLDGRVKTLHPKVHGGLLGDVRLDSHKSQMAEAGIEPISILAVNLYRFEETSRTNPTIEDAIESIDIGGPAMIRAAAKNWANVAVVVEPEDYNRVLKAIDDENLADLRLGLSAKAYRHTAFYDSMISRWLSDACGEGATPEKLTLGLRRVQSLRYGENPHQDAAVYEDPLTEGGLLRAKQLGGKELSYNNLLDADAAWELACDLPENACAIIKHTNPCGASWSGSAADNYRLARSSDPISAFGGIAAFHCEVDAAAAEAMTEKGNFLEVIIAASYTDEAVEIITGRSGWGQNVRVLQAPVSGGSSFLSVRSIRGGALVQFSDEDPDNDWEWATEAKPTPDQEQALRRAWQIIPHVKSNAILVANADQLLGTGAGQMNRVQSVRLSLEQAGDKAKGAVLASDAFFPFPDSIEAAAEAGIAAIVQPGGSKKDSEVIEAANRHGIVMALTGVRHFRH